MAKLSVQTIIKILRVHQILCTFKSDYTKREYIYIYILLLRYAIISRVCFLGRFGFEKISKSVLCLLRTARTKCESGSLFDTKIPSALWVVDCVIVVVITIKFTFKLLINYML